MAMSRKQIMYLYATGVFKRLPAGMKASKGEVSQAKKMSGKSNSTSDGRKIVDGYAVNVKKGYSTETKRTDATGKVSPKFVAEVEKNEDLPQSVYNRVTSVLGGRDNTSPRAVNQKVAEYRKEYDKLPEKTRVAKYKKGFHQFASEKSRDEYEEYQAKKKSTPKPEKTKTRGYGPSSSTLRGAMGR